MEIRLVQKDVPSPIYELPNRRAAGKVAIRSHGLVLVGSYDLQQPQRVLTLSQPRLAGDKG